MVGRQTGRRQGPQWSARRAARQSGSSRSATSRGEMVDPDVEVVRSGCAEALATEHSGRRCEEGEEWRHSYTMPSQPSQCGRRAMAGGQALHPTPSTIRCWWNNNAD